MDMMDPRSFQQTMSHQNSTHYAGSLKLSSLVLPHKISLPHLRRYHQKLTVRLAPWRATRQFPHGQASGMASGIRGKLGVRAAPIDIIEVREDLEEARALLKKSLAERDNINERLESNLAATIKAQASGQRTDLLEDQRKLLRQIQEGAAKKVAAAQNQLNNVVYAQNNSPSNTTIAGSSLGSMQPNNETIAALSRAMTF